MAASTDFNVSPYYDDFNESKKFHRILFRPAFAVQARELTQSQSIVQSQIEKFGDHMFQQGASVIPGQISVDTKYYAVKLTSKSASSINDYNNTTITGGSSGVIAEVIGVSADDGTDPDTLFVKYNKTGTNNTSTVFTDGETITSSGAGSPTAVVNTTATGSAAAVESGVYYINGFFVQADASVLILDKYTNSPSYRIGFTVTESFVTSNDDASLSDNAQGSSNLNAPGAHRFKILLTLAKKTLASTEDDNFYEIARVENGEIKSKVRHTEYAVLEDTFARRTFDESGDYSLTNPDFEVREHLLSGTNRGIFTGGNGGSATKLAIGVSPFKAYVRGYENETIGTTFVALNKAREFDTQNNHKQRFDVQNFINVNNVFGSPDIGFVGSGPVEAYKTVNLFDTATAVRGTQQSTVGTTIPQIGRAKSRGFETVSATESLDINATSSIYRHYLFDIEMFTHLELTTTGSFTTGEVLSGASSGATGIVESITATLTFAGATCSTTPAPDGAGVFTKSAHGLKDGQQVNVSGGSMSIASTAYTPGIFTIRNSTTNTFELYSSDGLTPQVVTAFSSSPTFTHTTIVLSSVKGTFTAGETISGQTSNVSGTLQSDVLGLKAATTREVSAVKQIGMAGSPTYTSDTDLTSTHGANLDLVGVASIANATNNLIGKGTNFTRDLKIGDSISFINDAGSTVTALVKNIVSQTQATLTANVGAADVSTSTIITRKRSKIVWQACFTGRNYPSQWKV